MNDSSPAAAIPMAGTVSCAAYCNTGTPRKLCVSASRVVDRKVNSVFYPPPLLLGECVCLVRRRSKQPTARPRSTRSAVKYEQQGVVFHYCYPINIFVEL